LPQLLPQSAVDVEWGGCGGDIGAQVGDAYPKLGDSWVRATVRLKLAFDRLSPVQAGYWPC